jgi:predicted nucleic acid-binding protein
MILDGSFEYACVSKISVAETGYILERKTNDGMFAYNCMIAMINDLTLDVLDISWEFIIDLAHAKAINSFSFCDNVTITAAKQSNSQALFSKEKEIINKGRTTWKVHQFFLSKICKPNASQSFTG